MSQRLNKRVQLPTEIGTFTRMLDIQCCELLRIGPEAENTSVANECHGIVVKQPMNAPADGRTARDA